MSANPSIHRIETASSSTPRCACSQVRRPFYVTIKYDRRVDDEIMRLVLDQLSKVLEHDPQGRSQFVHSGGLALLQEMAEAPDSRLTDSVDAINRHYPEEIVMHYSPSYSQKLLEKLDAQITQTVN